MPASLDAASTDALTQPAEEALLVRQARAGDQAAFGVLVRLHQRQVYTLALRMLRNPEDATEATQEVFLAAWQGLSGFRGDARFATWLYRIAYNYCLKLAERQRRDASVRAELATESARTRTPEGALSARMASDAEAAMRETVRGEIANLPAKYRAVLVLRHLQELSYEEMAEVMRVPIGTVKTQLFRARALLRERLEPLGRFRAEGMTRAGDVRAGIEAGLRGILDRARELSAEGEA
ncbi:MAG: RNA polymerase sigma factor [Ktedonobacterales bacterium]